MKSVDNHKHNTISRRQFLLGIAAPFFVKNKPFRPKLAFNTLACPDWSVEKIIRNAAKYGYQGVELRGIGNELNLTKSSELSKTRLVGVKSMCRNEGVEIINLNSSAVLHEYLPEKRTQNLDEVKAYVDLAAELGCPFVRVFPDIFPKEKTKNEAQNIILNNYQSLVDYCKGSNVSVLLDAHGDLVESQDLKNIMNLISGQNAGLIWDFFNMHLKTGESPEAIFQNIKGYTKLVQLKDGFFLENQKYKYTQTGKGQVPMKEILELLKKQKYAGFVSFEWEKRWHPELAEPEIALPHFVEFIRKNT